MVLSMFRAMSEFLKDLKRTHDCGALRLHDEGKQVVLFGWVSTRRDHGGCVFIDDKTCMVDLALNITKFYRHESCGKCTPCREGTHWMENILTQFEHGEGTLDQIDHLYHLCDMILGKSFCALGDAAAMPVMSFIQKFRGEFEAHVRDKRCAVNRRRDELAPYRTEAAPAAV